MLTLIRLVVRIPPCAIACINICRHVEDSVAHVRVRWVMKTLKHSACIVGSATLSQVAFLEGRNPNYGNAIFFLLFFFFFLGNFYFT